MAKLDARSYALRIIEAVEVYRVNGANKEDYITYLTELLDDYVSERINRRVKKSDSPLSILTALANKGDYSTALTHLHAVADIELAYLLKLLLDALATNHGTAEDLQAE